MQSNYDAALEEFRALVRHAAQASNKTGYFNDIEDTVNQEVHAMIDRIGSAEVVVTEPTSFGNATYGPQRGHGPRPDMHVAQSETAANKLRSQVVDVRNEGTMDEFLGH